MLVILLLSAIFIVFVVYFTFDVYRVASSSMEPTLVVGNYVIVSRYHYFLFNPKHDDIVVFKSNSKYFNKGPWVHRVVGVSGDTMSVNNNKLYVNGELVKYPVVDTKTPNRIFYSNNSIILAKGELFQKGDNFSIFFSIVNKSEGELIGKVIFVF